MNEDSNNDLLPQGHNRGPEVLTTVVTSTWCHVILLRLHNQPGRYILILVMKKLGLEEVK